MVRKTRFQEEIQQYEKRRPAIVRIGLERFFLNSEIASSRHSGLLLFFLPSVDCSPVLLQSLTVVESSRSRLYDTMAGVPIYIPGRGVRRKKSSTGRKTKISTPATVLGFLVTTNPAYSVLNVIWCSISP